MFFIESVAMTGLLSALVYLNEGVSRNFCWGISGHIRDIDGSLKEYANGHFSDSLDTGCFISLHLVDSDIVLAITC